MRLGVFPRAAIVASGLWLLGGSFYFANQTAQQASAYAGVSQRLCTDEQHMRDPNDTNVSRCSAEWTRAYEVVSRDLWSNAFAEALILLATVWVAFGIIYGLIRWVMAGRRVKST